MKASLTGRAAKFAQWTVSSAVMVVFMLSGIGSALAPYTVIVGPVTLLVLIAGYYYIIPSKQREEYPKNTAATALMLAAFHIFFVAMVEAPESLVSPEGAIAGIALAAIIIVGLWKDYVLEPMDIDGFEIEIGGSNE